MERIFGLHQMNYSLQLITAPDSEGRRIILSAPSSRCSSRSRVNPPSSCSTGCVTTSQGHSFYSGSPLFSQVSLHLSAYLDHPDLARHQGGLWTSVSSEYMPPTGGRCVCACGFKQRRWHTSNSLLVFQTSSPSLQQVICPARSNTGLPSQ